MFHVKHCLLFHVKHNPVFIFNSSIREEIMTREMKTIKEIDINIFDGFHLCYTYQ